LTERDGTATIGTLSLDQNTRFWGNQVIQASCGKIAGRRFGCCLTWGCSIESIWNNCFCFREPTIAVA
jgi:hypothetical protein